MTASWWRLIGIPVVVVIAAQALRPIVAPWLGAQTQPVQMFSFLAVFIAAWAGGFWAGIFASSLSIVAAYVGVYLVTGSAPLLGTVDATRIVLFLSICFVFSV